MNIEIITTGDEVMQGVIVDTNTAWMAEKCSQLGHEVLRHTSVADDLDDIGEVLLEASKKADAVIVTGGLGPTADDITVEAAARAFKIELNLNQDVLAEIRDSFRKSGREMSSSNDKQALIPEGGSVIPNKMGTAPGIKVKLGGAEFFFLPGVPKELYQMFDDSVMPWLHKNSKSAISTRVLRVFGIPEATIDEKLKGVDLGNVRLSFRVKYPEIILKVLARAEDFSDAKNLTDHAARMIHDTLGSFVYAEGETSLAKVVSSLLSSKGETIAVAESCTGGLLCNIITDESGSSQYFEIGIVSYSNRSKQELLGVSEEVLRANGAVSAQTAMAMAEGAKKIGKTTYGLGITGIAGPGGGTPEKPVGTVHIAIATPDETDAYEYHFNRERVWFKQIVAWTTLDLVRKHLL